jgi:hypothetical protein
LKPGLTRGGDITSAITTGAGAVLPDRRSAPGLTNVCKDDGTHYTKEGLGNFFHEAVAAGGIPITKRGSKEKGYSGHGLRKASRPSPPRAEQLRQS